MLSPNKTQEATHPSDHESRVKTLKERFIKGQIDQTAIKVNYALNASVQRFKRKLWKAISLNKLVLVIFSRLVVGNEHDRAAITLAIQGENWYICESVSRPSRINCNR